MHLSELSSKPKPKSALILSLRVRANDEPHGVFALSPDQQSIVVVGSGSEVSRVVVLNVTRLAGPFGNASVGYRINGGMDTDEVLGAKAAGRILVNDGETSGSVTLPISSQVRDEWRHTRMPRQSASFLSLIMQSIHR